MSQIARKCMPESAKFDLLENNFHSESGKPFHKFLTPIGCITRSETCRLPSLNSAKVLTKYRNKLNTMTVEWFAHRHGTPTILLLAQKANNHGWEDTQKMRQGQPSNQNKKVVYIPKRQLFHHVSLKQLSRSSSSPWWHWQYNRWIDRSNLTVSARSISNT